MSPSRPINRIATATSVLVGALLMQIIFAPSLAILGVIPNFLLVAVVVMAFVSGSSEGTIIGFVAGLAYDLIGTAMVGPMALTLTLAGFAAGMLREYIFAGGWLLPVTVLGVASLLTESLYLIVLLLLGDRLVFGTAFLTRVLPGALYAMLIGVLVFPLLTRFIRKGLTSDVNTFKRIA